MNDEWRMMNEKQGRKVEIMGRRGVLRNAILPHQSVRVRPCLSVSVHPTPWWNRPRNPYPKTLGEKPGREGLWKKAKHPRAP